MTEPKPWCKYGHYEEHEFLPSCIDEMTANASTPDPDSPDCPECGGGMAHYPECSTYDHVRDRYEQRYGH
jgi:hypothetical protein